MIAPLVTSIATSTTALAVNQLNLFATNELNLQESHAKELADVVSFFVSLISCATISHYSAIHLGTSFFPSMLCIGTTLLITSDPKCVFGLNAALNVAAHMTL